MEQPEQKRTLHKEELKKIVDIYQQQGAVQFHFTGGEPMVRIHDLLDMIKHAKNKGECYVLTSGFNLTNENARYLKEAGCTGVILVLFIFVLIYTT